MPTRPLRTPAALLLSLSLLASGCAPMTVYRPVDLAAVGVTPAAAPASGPVTVAQALTPHRDVLRITRKDGSAVQGVLTSVDEHGLQLAGQPRVPREDIARIERQQAAPGADAARTAGQVAGAATVMVVLPFMLLCAAVTGDNRSSGSCAWGH